MSLQPSLPAPSLYSVIERAYISEEPPGLWPENQDSNFGLHRKIFCDILMEIATQLDLLLNEKFLATTNLFLEAHEEELGLTLNPANVSLAQRKSALLARRKRGPFTHSLRRQVIESFIQGALSGGSPATFGTGGIPLGAGGIPLYSGLSGLASDYYSIIENVSGFSYAVVIDSRVTPDMTGLTRELTRITPAGISFSITGGGGATIVQKTGGGKSAGKFGATRGNTPIPKTGGAKSSAVGGGTKIAGAPGTGGSTQLPLMFFVSGATGGSTPQPVTIRSKTNTVQSTSAVYTTPVLIGAASAGDKIVVVLVCSDQSKTDGWVTPSGWNNKGILATANEVMQVFEKTAVGTEAGTTVNFTLNTASGAGDQVNAETIVLTATGVTPAVLVSFVEDTGGPTLVTPSITPSLDNALVLGVVGQDQTAGTAPSIGSVTASDGATVAIEVDTIEPATFIVLAISSEAQTTARTTSHTFNYTGGGTATRGAAMAIIAATG